MLCLQEQLGQDRCGVAAFSPDAVAETSSERKAL
jgi:hypothetical protein